MEHIEAPPGRDCRGCGLRPPMEHIEARPTWDCRACGKPWPCPDVQVELKAQMSPTTIRIHMWTRLEVAAEDMPGATARDMFDRFLRWTP